MDSIQAKGEKILSGLHAIIDTGTTLVVGPASGVLELHEALGGKAAPTTFESGYYTCEFESGCSLLNSVDTLQSHAIPSRP